MTKLSDPRASTISTFTAQFGGEPAMLAEAPGRVNLIGEHTDYTGGLVLPAAIERRVRIAARPNGADMIRFYAADFRASAEFPAQAPAQVSMTGWARYPQGVAVQLVGKGLRLVGLDAVITGDLPIGSGLSSSAALEVATSLVLEHTCGQVLSPRERALLCRTAEVEFVGVPCGIMDQIAATLCRRGHALFLDCRSLQTHHIPLGPDVVLAVCDTGVRRNLVESPYALRQQECVRAIESLRSLGRAVASLRDLTLDDLPLIECLPDPLRRRIRHVVTENSRVVDTARLLTGGDIDLLREVFLASHLSLRNDYEVSSPELDAMVEAALDTPGCLAARMTGAGFGGSVVALVRRGGEEEFLQRGAGSYKQRTGRTGSFFVTEAADGARLIKS